jgi:hypothetical protein
MRTQDLNALEHERYSLIAQIELIKYALFEQIHRTDVVLHTYRTSLKSFRSTLDELEQQLKQQADDGLSSLHMNSMRDSSSLIIQHENVHHVYQRSTIRHDSQHIASIFVKQIDDQRTNQMQLEKNIAEYDEKILRQEQLLSSKTIDYTTMNDNNNRLEQEIIVGFHCYE